MKPVESIIGEMQKSISAWRIFGDPLTARNHHPAVKLGFRLWCMFGGGKGQENGEGRWRGWRPRIESAVVVDKTGMGVEPLKQAHQSMVETLAQVMTKIMESVPKTKEMHDK